MDLLIATEPERAKLLGDYLRREFRILRGKGLRVGYREKPAGCFRCRLYEKRFFGRRDRSGFRAAVVTAVTKLLVAEWESLIGEELLRRAEWLDKDDWDLVREQLNNDRGMLEQFQGRVEARISRYLQNSSILNVEGFVRFRLQDLIDLVGSTASRVLDEQLFQQENQDFIRMLKNFVAEKGQCSTVHIILTPPKTFRIYDERMCLVATNAEELGINDDEVNHEDLLISSVVALGPEKVILHGQFCLAATRATLQEVFGKALVRCSGCNLCSIWNNA
ncbi:MAG: sporulation protein YtxC [Bacillota bacterium]